MEPPLKMRYDHSIQRLRFIIKLLPFDILFFYWYLLTNVWITLCTVDFVKLELSVSKQFYPVMANLDSYQQILVSEARASRDHFFSSPDFDQLWPSMMTACLFTEVKQQWATLVLGDRFSALLLSLMALQHSLLDRNPFWPCLCLNLQLHVLTLRRGARVL